MGDISQTYFETEQEAPYTILRILGHEASATVEEVRNNLTEKVYARKTFTLRHGRHGAQDRAIFENELRTLRKIRHHHHIIDIIACYEIKNKISVC